MSVTILENSTSPGMGHKFKVVALMLNRMTAVGFFWPEEPAQLLAKEVMSGEFAKEELEANRAMEKKQEEDQRAASSGTSVQQQTQERD